MSISIDVHRLDLPMVEDPVMVDCIAPGTLVQVVSLRSSEETTLPVVPKWGSKVFHFLPFWPLLSPSFQLTSTEREFVCA